MKRKENVYKKRENMRKEESTKRERKERRDSDNKWNGKRILHLKTRYNNIMKIQN